MMRMLTALLLFWVAPFASAQSALDALNCDRALAQVLEGATGAFGALTDETNGRHTVDASGWCVLPVDATSGPEIRWKASGLSDYLEAGSWPEELRLVMEFSRTPGRAIVAQSLSATLTYDDASQILSVAGSLEFFDSDHLAIVTGILSGFDGSSAAAMRLSIGSIRLTKFTAIAEGSGPTAPLFWFTLLTGTGPQNRIDPGRVEAIKTFMAAVSDTVPTRLIPEASQVAMDRFFSRWPEADGRLSFDLTFPVGIGPYTLGSFLGRIEDGVSVHDPDTDVEAFVSQIVIPALDILLSEAEIVIRWDPR